MWDVGDKKISFDFVGNQIPVVRAIGNHFVDWATVDLSLGPYAVIVLHIALKLKTRMHGVFYTEQYYGIQHRYEN
jgi:hypothetical protein